MNVRPQEMPRNEFYRLLVHTVAPRPIAWVSTVDREGVPNLAPYSFFNVLSATPPLLGFCPGMRTAALREEMGSGVKDSLRNARETGEFVVNVVTYELGEAMNLSSGDYDAAVSEFDVAKLATRPSTIVKPPQVAGSPVSFECKVFEVLQFGNEIQGGSLIIGEILCVHLEESALREGRVDCRQLDLIGRLGGLGYCRTNERFDMVRPPRPPKAE